MKTSIQSNLGKTDSINLSDNFGKLHFIDKTHLYN